jgi:hypothetical protein
LSLESIIVALVGPQPSFSKHSLRGSATSSLLEIAQKDPGLFLRENSLRESATRAVLEENSLRGSATSSLLEIA